MAKLATTFPWKGSMKQALKTNFLPFVTFGLVDQGEIWGIPALSAMGAPALEHLLDWEPIIATTLSWLISFWNTVAVDSGLFSSSSMTNLTFFCPPSTLIPPLALISS